MAKTDCISVDDSLVVLNLANTLDGLAGNDTLTGGAGIDTLFIIAGTDLGADGADVRVVWAGAAVNATLATA